MKWLDDIPELKGAVALLRTGLNVPIDSGRVVNDFRIRRALPTIEHLSKRGARVIVISHIGREGSETLAPVAEALNTYLPVRFGARDELTVHEMSDGDVVLLENLRQDPREVANDDGFARELADLADVFVQDAFSVCHREHASIVSIPRHLPSYGGLLLEQELKALTRARRPEHPALFILGGAKFETKEPLIEQFLDLYDAVFVGGALANEILAARGFPIGRSRIGDAQVTSGILEDDALFPVSDVVVEHADGSVETVVPADVGADDVIVDIGMKTTCDLIDRIPEFNTIVWNGPFGWYERGYTEASIALARAITKSAGETIIGGGDTVAVVQDAGLEGQFDFTSTGGGAMLAFLKEGTLPGVVALN